MSESAQIRGVLLGHGGMPDGMVDAVRHITGCDPSVLTPVSNRGKSPDAMAAEVLRILGNDPGIVFTDLQSGSCGFVARRLTHDAPNLGGKTVTLGAAEVDAKLGELANNEDLSRYIL